MYEAPAMSLLYDERGVTGVRARVSGRTRSLVAGAVVLASGGFQANAEWRNRYLGPGWDLAKVRGTRFNTGQGHRMALEAGAGPVGHWSGCHAVAWDRNAPDFGDLAVGDPKSCGNRSSSPGRSSTSRWCTFSATSTARL